MPQTVRQPVRAKVLWLARLEYRFHAWRERRARRRGQKPTVTPFPGYGGPGWVRVLGRVLIVPPAKVSEAGEYAERARLAQLRRGPDRVRAGHGHDRGRRHMWSSPTAAV